jgi:PEGA domain
MRGLLVAAALAAGVSACATVTRGTTNQIQIRSEPAGAQVTTSLAHNCTTPCTISVNRREEFAVVFNLPGYREQRVEVKTQVAGAGAAGFVGNVIVGGVVGMGVDAVTGSTLEHLPNPVVVTLQRDVATPPPRVNPRQPAARVASRAPGSSAPARAPVAPALVEEVAQPAPPRISTEPLAPGIVPPSQ